MPYTIGPRTGPLPASSIPRQHGTPCLLSASGVSTLSDFGGSKYGGTAEKCSYDAPVKSVSWWMVGGKKGVGAAGADILATASIGVMIGESSAILCVCFVVIWEPGNGRAK